MANIYTKQLKVGDRVVKGPHWDHTSNSSWWNIRDSAVGTVVSSNAGVVSVSWDHLPTQVYGYDYNDHTRAVKLEEKDYYEMVDREGCIIKRYYRDGRTEIRAIDSFGHSSSSTYYADRNIAYTYDYRSLPSEVTSITQSVVGTTRKNKELDPSLLEVKEYIMLNQNY